MTGGTRPDRFERDGVTGATRWRVDPLRPYSTRTTTRVIDEVWYSRRRPVRVVLSDIPLGSADRLEGGTGPDVLDGQGGRDLLIGGTCRDTLDGGRGRDRIRAGDGDRDWVLCGPGFDRVAASAAADVVLPLESVDYDGRHTPADRRDG
jgi:Ca2+-binding RTX toxin-like protein